MIDATIANAECTTHVRHGSADTDGVAAEAGAAVKTKAYAPEQRVRPAAYEAYGRASRAAMQLTRDLARSAAQIGRVDAQQFSCRLRPEVTWALWRSAANTFREYCARARLSTTCLLADNVPARSIHSAVHSAPPPGHGSLPGGSLTQDILDGVSDVVS